MKFEFKIESENAAMLGYSGIVEVIDMLRETARKINHGGTAGNLFDSNGNTVGSWKMEVKEEANKED